MEGTQSMSEWQTQVNEFKSAGFTDTEIAEQANADRYEMSNAGFSVKEIDDYFGVQKPDMKPLQKQFEENMQPVHQKSVPMNGELGDNKADTFVEALEAGWDMSVAGLLKNNKMPSQVLPEQAPMFHRIAAQVGTLVGDIPAMIGGAVTGGEVGAMLGGAVGSIVPGPGTVAGAGAGTLLGAGYGAMAVPALMRKALLEEYEKGTIQDFGDFWERSSAALIEANKQGLIGAASMGVGNVVGKLAAPLAMPVVQKSAVVASEIATMVTVGSALEGHAPRAQDFLDASVLIAGLTGTTKVAGKIRSIYRDTGVKPAEVFQEAQVNPVLKQELLIDSDKLPKTYESLIDSKVKKLSAEAELPKPVEVNQELTRSSEIFGEGFNQNEIKFQELPKEKPAVAASKIERSEAEAKVLSRIGQDAGKEKLNWGKVKEKANEVYTNMVDDLHPVEVLEGTLKGDKSLSVIDSPYKLLRLTRGNFGRIKEFVHGGAFEFKTLKTVGKSFDEILAPIKNDPDGFRAYALSKRAIELEGRGIKTGIDTTAAREVVGKGKAKYESVMKDVVEFQNHALNYLKDSGILSPKAHKLMLEANKEFVSFKRIMDEGEAVSGSSKNVRNPVKSIKGSDRLIQDPLQTAVENTALYITLAEKNRALTSLVKLAEESPKGEGLVSRVKTEMVPVEVKPEEVSKALREMGVSTADHADLDGFTVFRPKSNPLRENEFAIFRNGKREVYEVQPEVAKAIKGLDAQTTGLVLRMMGKFTQTLKAGSVLAPEFMGKNISRDLMTAFSLGKGFFTPLDSLSGLGSLLKQDAHYQNWLKSGGSNSSFMSIDQAYLKDNVFKLSKETGLIDKTWNVVKSPIEGLRALGELAENSTRLGEYKRATKGATEGAGPMMEGGYRAREISLDFAKLGAKTRSANQIIAFLGAQINGLDKTFNTIKERPIESMAKITATITAPSVALWWVNHDQDWYKEIPRWQKDVFWVFKAGETIYRIPKPQELGLIFGTIPERTLEAYFAENPRAFKDFEETMISAFTPSMVPTAVAPVVEQYFNKSLFTGHQLVPSSLEGIAPQYQYNEYTTEAGKAISKFVTAVPGLKDTSLASPMVIENYVRAWSGTLGRYALEGIENALIKSGAVPDPIRPTDTLSDIPFVKAFVIRDPSSSAQSIQDFYSRFEENAKKADTIKFLAKQGDFVNMQYEMMADPPIAQLKDMRKTLAENAKAVRMIYNSKLLTPDEKRQAIDSFYYRMINVAKLGNQIMDSLEEGMKKIKKENEEQ